MNRPFSVPDDAFLHCPHCGASLAEDAEFCVACGASEESGWVDEDDAPWDERREEDFDYNDFLRREFPDQALPADWPSARQALFAVVVVLLCLAFVLMTVLR